MQPRRMGITAPIATYSRQGTQRFNTPRYQLAMLYTEMNDTEKLHRVARLQDTRVTLTRKRTLRTSRSPNNKNR